MRRIIAAVLLILWLYYPTDRAVAESMTFDQTRWITGDMNEQAPSDSNGTAANSHVDYFYYRERLPMCLAVIADSLAAGSSSRTYDSAVLALVVAASGLAGSDSMRIFGERVSRPWSEGGVSWTYHHASPDSDWSAAGGDVDGQPCMDTIIVDQSVTTYDTLYFHLDTGFVRSMVEQVNHGWMMMAENIVDRATFQFFTEDVSSEAYWPKLTVYYSGGGEQAVYTGRRRRR
jgi:hypothetical protein